jgi:hypothetical protein
MDSYYYDITYMETEEGKLIDSNPMLIESTSELTPSQIKDFVRDKIGKPSAIITLPRLEKIDRATFIAKGGVKTAPWFKGED